MLRSNTKKARENLQNFILSCRLDDDFSSDSFKDCAVFIINQFNDYISGDLRRGRLSEQELFYHFMQGLPCGNLTDFFLGCDTAKNILGGILEQNEKEKERYNNDGSINMLCYLIYNECLKAINK